MAQLANEPFKNGWKNETDPALLELAAVFATSVGHQDFSIGDPLDGSNADSSAETTAEFLSLARHSKIVVLHPDRSYGGSDTRWRRWLDHLEGMTDVVDQLSKGVAYVIDEPIDETVLAGVRGKICKRHHQNGGLFSGR